MAPNPNTHDAVIIGSGITGGWAAKELTERGLNTLVLEAGRTIVPEQDYVEHVPVWEVKYRGWDNRAERERTQHIQRECYYACDEFSHKFFVNDVDNPYSTDPGKHFSWIRGRQVGGKSITWGRQSYRLAHSLRRHRSLVRLRRGIRRHQRPGRGASPTS